jgi:hypothetical protein
MALTNHDQARVREYLLGHLSDEDLTKLEERLMLEDDLFEELEISKGELIEEYCAGELNQDDQQWFEHNYLASAEGRQRHVLALAIDCLNRSEPALVGQPSFFEKLAAFWTRPRWVVAGMSAVLVLVLAVIWMRSLQQPGTIVTAALINTEVNRSNGAPILPAKVHLPDDASELRALLTLPKTFPPGTRVKAVLDNRTERKQVSVVDQKENVITVTIPASDLPPGEYELVLTATRTDGAEEPIRGSYRFDVN